MPTPQKMSEIKASFTLKAKIGKILIRTILSLLFFESCNVIEQTFYLLRHFLLHLEFLRTVTLTLCAQVITQHRPQDEVFFGTQHVERSRGNQPYCFQALTPAKIDVQVVFACGLQHIVDVLTLEPGRNSRLKPFRTSEENHLSNSLLVFVNVVHQNLQVYWCGRHVWNRWKKVKQKG